MKTLVNTTDFSDCTYNDFIHYFSGTVMIWSLPNTKTKRRAFIVGEVENQGNGTAAITGQYLTKLKEWKHKKIKWEGWNENLKPLAIRDMYFRVGNGVTLHSPSLSRTSGALKKSVPWTYRSMMHFGKIDPTDITTQGLTWWAFNDLYDFDRDRERTLAEILIEPNGLSAEADSDGFIVDRSVPLVNTLYYRSKKIGQYVPSVRVLDLAKSADGWLNFLKTSKGLGHHGIKFKGDK